MTALRIPTRRTSFTSPVVDCEPEPNGVLSTPVQFPPPAPCPQPSPAALHRHTPRSLRPVSVVAAAPPRPPQPLLPRAVAVFADTALRRVLEVADRRRPVTQLRPLLAPTLLDAVATLTRTATTAQGAAVLRRVRLQPSALVEGEATAAEVFATYTRGPRVRAIAGRIELTGGRWLVVALQIG